MTDKETLTTLFDRAGVVWEADAGGTHIQPGETKPIVYESSIVVSEGSGPRNIGYSMFLTVFYFNRDDTLAAVGAWE